MSDLRMLLRDAAGRPLRGFDGDRAFDRARSFEVRRQVAKVTAFAVVTAVMAVGFPAILKSRTTNAPVARPSDELVVPTPVDAGNPTATPSKPPTSARPANQRNTPPAVGGTPSPPAVSTSLAHREAPSAPLQRVAFVRGDTIYTQSVNGTDPDLVAVDAHSPAWSADGAHIAYISVGGPDGGRGNLAIANADGSRAKLIRGPVGATNGYTVDSPTWSPDGKRVAFVQRYCGATSPATERGEQRCDPPITYPPSGFHRSEIRTIRVDGSDEALIAGGADTYNESPAWSPDGRRIAYASTRNQPEAWQLRLVNPDGSGDSALTSQADGSDSRDPSWSPTGEWIAFVALPSDQPMSPCNPHAAFIAMISVAGTEHPRVTDPGSQACDAEPSWSSEGDFLVFTRRTSGDTSVGTLWAVSPVTTTGSLSRLGDGIQGAVQPRS